ncbi:MAG: bifunctional oligoribonuclease/PAP phosphatase NrnA [Firmicutes bacterium]|nr:bifunctional oligoribonuclease/PAP phosphatase NrnA [Bacillota bacterium]
MIKINNNVIKKIYKKIKEYDKIVIARHIGPDPDAIASQTALRDSIRLTFPNKEVSAVGLGVSKFKYYGILDKIENEKFEDCLLIVLDVPNLVRVDGIDGLKYKEILKIDHHPAEDIKGKVDWTEETSCSTCQMIAELILKSPLKLDTKIAGNLYLGIVSDSDRFLLSYTTPKTFKIVNELLEESKIDFTSLYNYLYDRSLDEVRFQGYLANNMIVTEHGLGYIIIPNEVIKEYNVDLATPSNLINSFNFIREVIVWTFITEDSKNNSYKVSIRSHGPVVNKTAAKYNGGGHKFASGARLTSEEEINNFINDLDTLCEEYKRASISNID